MPPSAWEQVAQSLLDNLNTARTDLEQIVQQFRTELGENNSARAVLEEQVKNLSRTITQLDKLLRGGNGNTGFEAQLTADRLEIESLKAEVANLKTSVAKLKQANRPVWLQILIQSSPVLVTLVLGGIGWLLYFMFKNGWTPP